MRGEKSYELVHNIWRYSGNSAAFILVTGLIVFPTSNTNNNLLMLDRSDQIAHATTVGM